MRAPTGAVVSMATLTNPPEGAVDQPTRTGRRSVGVLILLAAVLAAVAIPMLLRPGIAGHASAADLPLPPPVGSCVVIADSDIAVVPCDSPHSGEVAMSWPAGIEPADDDRTPPPTLTFSFTRSLPQSHSDYRCDPWVADYTGWRSYVERHRADLWIPPQPLATGILIAAPPHAGLPDRHWTACVATTADSLYIGSIRNVTQGVTPRPDAVSVCLDGVPTVEFLACSEPHTTEVLGSVALTQPMILSRSVTVDLTPADVQQACVDLAARLTGSTDPTFGGRLEIVTESIWQQSVSATMTSRSWLIPDCLVQVSGSGELVGTVIGLGTGQLPLTR